MFLCISDAQRDRDDIYTGNRSYTALLHESIYPLLLSEIFTLKYPGKIIYSLHNEARNTHSRIDFFCWF